MPLTAEDFAVFVADVHSQPAPAGGPARRREPFPWQRALLDRILTEGRWPEVIDVPTGLGKTSVLDVSVFLAALRPDLARRRTFFVVDRRLVVDEAHEHARKIQVALRATSTPVCRAVAKALHASGDTSEGVLTVARMRGGVTWDRIWLERPDQHAIVTGTVDQVGSRLLFRGYGVSEFARSIDAALVGTDSLIIVDEAHLANAFNVTIDAALALDRWSIARKPTVVTMSATSPGRDPAEPGIRPHGISADDETHPIAGRRLRAKKRIHLTEVKTTRKKANGDVPRALAELAARMAPQGVVGVVVNTVARARAVFNLLDGTAEAILLTGRSRPIDRDLLLDRYYDRINVDRDRDDRRPFIVVATQTIEVGANIDLDALVTESAPLPALIQRLGRLNRLGLHDTPALAHIVHDSSVDTDDPVYGPARLAAWQWLVSQRPDGALADPERGGKGIDGSPAALRTLRARAPQDTIETAPAYVPLLSAATLDAWTRTSPAPHPDPPVAPYLHGINEEVPAVSVVWRTGLPLQAPERWPAVVDIVPPVTEETIDVSIRAVRRWLSGSTDSDAMADIDLALPDADDQDTSQSADAGPGRAERARDGRGQPLVLHFPRRGAGTLIPTNKIRPGDTIVVPVEYGGCDRFGWHPDSTAPVVDVADLASRRGKPVLRIGPYLRHVATYTANPVSAPADISLANALDELLDFVASDPRPDRPEGYQERLKALAAALAKDQPLRRVLDPLVKATLMVTPTEQLDGRTGNTWTPDFPIVLSAARSRNFGDHSFRQADDDSEAGSSGSAYPGQRIKLDAHQRAVAARAAEMARNLGLPQHLEASVKAAAGWHDEGKRDIRFQTMLFAGRRAAAELAAAPLAKSGIDPTNRAEARRARRAARYPEGMRHEALSARIAAIQLAENPEKLDPPLVVHLVASHHGRSRPLLPPVVDKEPIKVTVPGLPVLASQETVDWESPARFANLNHAYGRWGLALLETVVRLADIWCSARDEEITS